MVFPSSYLEFNERPLQSASPLAVNEAKSSQKKRLADAQAHCRTLEQDSRERAILHNEFELPFTVLVSSLREGLIIVFNATSLQWSGVVWRASPLSMIDQHLSTA